VTLITSRDKTVAVIVQTRAAVPPQHAFKVNVPIDLSLVFKGWGPFPAVRGWKTRPVHGPRRRLSESNSFGWHYGDRDFDLNTRTEYTVGHSFAYQVTGFTNILGRLAEGVRGEWTFTPDGEGTVSRWTYEFKPRRGRYFLAAEDSLRCATICRPALRLPLGRARRLMFALALPLQNDGAGTSNVRVPHCGIGAVALAPWC
jgi:hypothetical protein